MEKFKDHVIVIGTYEEFVLGYQLAPKIKKKSECELSISFTCRGHSGPVRCVAAGSKYCISGGSDEVCKIYNMAEKNEHGTLMHHDGTITCAAIHETTHVLTASDDHSLAIVRTGNWQVEKTLYKHQAGIVAMAVHPSGKLAFTAGKDKKLITWNLVKARPAFITNLKGIAEFIVVSPDGLRYAVGIHRRVDIYSIESAGVEYTIELKGRPNCLVFLDNDTVVLGGEDPDLQMHSLIEKVLIKRWAAHETRVRCLCVLPPNKAAEEVKEDDDREVLDADGGKIASEKEADDGGGKFVVSGSSSDNMIKVWKVTTESNTEVELAGSIDTNCRVTCMCVWHPGMRALPKKRKKNKEAAESSSTVSEVLAQKKKVKLSCEDGEKKQSPAEVIIETQETTAVDDKKKKKKKQKKGKSEEVK